MATDNKIYEFIDIIDQVLSHGIDEIIANDKWGDANFTPVEKNLRTLFLVLEKVRDYDFSIVPEYIISNLTDHLTKIESSIIDIIKVYSVENENSGKLRNSIISNINQTTEKFVTDIGPYLGVFSVTELMTDKELKELNNSADEIDSLLEKTFDKYKKSSEEIDAAVKDVDAAIDAAKAAAGKAGVGAFSEDFAFEAEQHRESSVVWLWVTGGMAVTSIIVAIFYSSLVSFPADVADNIRNVTIFQYVASKLVVLGLLFTGTLWCGRMYRTAKHLQTINLQRAHGLETFRAFHAAASDPFIKDAVLMETTRSIFGIAPTGYLPEGGKSSEGNQIVEVVKKIGPGGSGD